MTCRAHDIWIRRHTCMDVNVSWPCNGMCSKYNPYIERVEHSCCQLFFLRIYFYFIFKAGKKEAKLHKSNLQVRFCLENSRNTTPPTPTPTPTPTPATTTIIIRRIVLHILIFYLKNLS